MLLIQKQYNINYNAMLINPIKDLSKNKDLIINLNTYRILYKSINNNPITALNNSDINLYNYKKINNINNNQNKFRNKFERPKSVLNIKFFNKLLINVNNNNLNKNFSHNNNINNKLFLPLKYEISKNESIRYDTEDDYKNIFIQNKNDNKLGVKS